MFELRISIDISSLNDTGIKIINNQTEEIKISSNLKDKLTCLLNKEDHKKDKVDNLYEVMTGILQIMRVKSENISLTDKYEFFRFLPIKRNNIILILAMSESISEEDFVVFIEKFLGKITYIRFFKDIQIESSDISKKEEGISITPFTRIIIYFDNQDSADNFYYEFNTKSFPNNKFEFIYCVFVEKIFYDVKSNLLSNVMNNIYKPIKLDPEKEQSELFCCPLCIEKLDTGCSGIHTIVNMTNVNRWENYKTKCKVCKKLTGLNIDIKASPIKCMKCADNSGGIIWCCMVCGFTGCDRYQLKHAIEHFNNTLHRYSIDLSSQRIWDYLGDTWVHRIIKITHKEENPSDSTTKNSETIFLENESVNSNNNHSLNSKEFLMRIENTISEYNFVLSSQLEEQRKYYESEINKLNEKSETNLNNKLKRLNELKELVNSKKMILENNKKFTKECQKKINQQEKRHKEICENIIFTKELINNLQADLEKETVKIDNHQEKLQKEMLEAKKFRKATLQQNLSDLYQELSAKDEK